MIVVFLVIAWAVAEATVALATAAHPRRLGTPPSLFLRKIDWQN
jgi:hypothetical protein